MRDSIFFGVFADALDLHLCRYFYIFVTVLVLIHGEADIQFKAVPLHLFVLCASDLITVSRFGLLITMINVTDKKESADYLSFSLGPANNNL